MNPQPASSEADIERLLGDPAHAGHPLRAALDALWQDHQHLLRRIERVTQLSDGMQSMAHAHDLNLGRRLERQLRQLEKITRISDRYQSMMRELNIALEQASTHDLLTGLANRRLLLARLKAEGERSERKEGCFTLALVDVDRFKSINDRFGHDVGDQVLVRIARALEGSLREYDLCGRWGGEEFLILLADTQLAEASAIVQRLQDAVRALRCDDISVELRVSVSIGVAEHQSADTVDQTVARADAALLQAKREGRDRVVLAS